MLRLCLFVISMGLAAPDVRSEEPDPGHSHEGEAFDEGPRSLAQLVPNDAAIAFEVTACSPDAKQFINQGIGQLHGFLNFEAERSFRHAAYLDGDCMMAYWGMALANTVWARNRERALAFVEKARARWTPAHTERERLYLESIEGLAHPDHEAGSVAYAQKLKEIYTSYPDDLDAKAFFVAEVWQRKLHGYFGFEGEYRERTLPLDGLAKEVLAVNPNHPVHHYVVHMWDNKDDYPLALASADRIGWSGPTVAHLWHMAGHIFYQAELPFETWWQQEAGARVDHAYMQTMTVFPFMLHNHAHNNEWLTRTLMGLGNFDKALQIAGNLLAQAKHPTFNRVDQYQHLRTGADRMFDLIERGGYWELGAKLFASPFLECPQFRARPETYDPCRRVARLTEMFTGVDLRLDLADLPDGMLLELASVERLLQGDNPGRAWQDLTAMEDMHSGDALARLVQYGMLWEESPDLTQWAAALAADEPKNVMFQLIAAVAFAKDGELEKAQQTFLQAQAFSQEVDLGAPLVVNLVHKLRQSGLDIAEDWRREFDNWRLLLRPREPLESFGSLLWQVPTLENFTWVDSFGTRFDFETVTEGRSAVVLFILSGCPECDRQWATFRERRSEFEERGVKLLAITGQEENIPAFQQIGAYDEFESFLLHGLVVVNRDREIVWLDQGAEPFMDVDFVLSEVDRGLHPYQQKLMAGRWRELVGQ